jgi:cytochrome bd-type quinol oxidase subunit 2
MTVFVWAFFLLGLIFSAIVAYLPIKKETIYKEEKMKKEQLSQVCFVASLASVLVSIAFWVLMNQDDPAHGERFALFIGLWAPTLMGLANYFRQQV